MMTAVCQATESLWWEVRQSWGRGPCFRDKGTEGASEKGWARVCSRGLGEEAGQQKPLEKTSSGSRGGWEHAARSLPPAPTPSGALTCTRTQQAPQLPGGLHASVSLSPAEDRAALVDPMRSSGSEYVLAL